MINDIEDNYVEYLNDTIGYQWDAWDKLTQSEISEHDKILAGAEPETFNLKDLGVWAHCRRLFLEGHVEDFIELGRTLFEGERTKSPVLAYPEIAALICNMMIQENQLEEVEIFLSTRQQDYPDEVELKISAFILKAYKNENLESELLNIDDPELLFDLVEGLLAAGFENEAKTCFSVCKTKVGNQPLSAIHVDLDSMERKLAAL